MGDTAEVQQISDEELRQKRFDELDQGNLSPGTNLKLLFETLTHCSEPGDAEAMLAKIEGQEAAAEADDKEKKAVETEHSNGQFRVTFDSRNFPLRHYTWPEAFQLQVDEKAEFFYVLQSSDAQPDSDEQVYSTGFAADAPMSRMGEFGYRYECGSRARDPRGNLLSEGNDQIEFNYAEHKMMGEKLVLKWENGETTPGTRALQLPNSVKLSYGEINGLGGDFFGGYNPVSDDVPFEKQCEYFRTAFGNLATSNGAKKIVSDLLAGRQEEVEAIAKAVAEGKSTFAAYKAINRTTSLGVAQDDIYNETVTLTGDSPSYLRLAQINFDHFGQDAVKAYNAGHYCALQAAAGGNLELGYAMNAFADHYLGDCFASGHYRVPRRELHGSTQALGYAWDAFSGALQGALSGNTDGYMKMVAPDLLAMLMHNEDNKRGITVRNRMGTEFAIWGDKQLYEPQNKDNFNMMRQALQASVDEVYRAWESKTAKTPGSGHDYDAWKFAPAETVASKSHSPLFVTYELSLWERFKLYWPIKVRTPFSDPSSTRYEPIGGSAALIQLYNEINKSEQWKNY